MIRLIHAEKAFDKIPIYAKTLNKLRIKDVLQLNLKKYRKPTASIVLLQEQHTSIRSSIRDIFIVMEEFCISTAVVCTKIYKCDENELYINIYTNIYQCQFPGFDSVLQVRYNYCSNLKENIGPFCNFITLYESIIISK